MISRWMFLGLLLVVTTLSPDLYAQIGVQSPRVGILSTSATAGHLHQAFIAGMRDHGYIEGKNFRYDSRYAADNQETLEQYARELVGAKVAVIFVMNTPSALAAKKATSTIPILFTLVGNPIGYGLVRSLAAPGGNLTGFSLMNDELRAKRIEILHEMVPNLKRVGVLHNPKLSAIDVTTIPSIEKGAKVLGKVLLVVDATTSDDYNVAFSKLEKWRAQALMVMESALNFTHRKTLLERAAKNHWPTITGTGDYAEAGGLISFGADYADLCRRSADYAARILKGAKPADLPVQQPVKFELVINMKTAKALGISVPPHLLQRADRVIE